MEEKTKTPRRGASKKLPIKETKRKPHSQLFISKGFIKPFGIEASNTSEEKNETPLRGVI